MKYYFFPIRAICPARHLYLLILTLGEVYKHTYTSLPLINSVVCLTTGP